MSDPCRLSMDKVLAYASAYGTMAGSLAFLGDIEGAFREARRAAVDSRAPDRVLDAIDRGASYTRMLARQFRACRSEVLAVEMAERLPAGAEVWSGGVCRVSTGPIPPVCKSSGCRSLAVHPDGRCDECHKLHMEDMKADGEQAEHTRRMYP